MYDLILGIDHVVVTVRDLDAAADAWRRLGFTVSPRGVHSAHLGSGNHTIMLADDYIELLGVLTPTEHNRRSRDFLAAREGIDRVAMTTRDAQAGADALRARGLAATGPLDFGRPVDLPGGGTAEARFRTFHWPAGERPAGVGIFACQHLTREAVWIPALMAHANTARGLDRVEVLAGNPAAAAEHMGRLLERTPIAEPDGAVRVPSGPARADLVFLTRTTLAGRHPGVPLDALPEEGSACLAVRVADYAAAQTCVAAAGVPAVVAANRLSVAPAAASGVILEMRPG